MKDLKMQEVVFELNGKLFTKSRSVLTGKFYYRQYTIFSDMLTTPTVISRSKFYTALKKARVDNVVITTNFKTKPQYKI